MTCVFADVNGLHELNDTQGHRSGDRMLQAVAEAARKFGTGEVTFTSRQSIEVLGVPA